MAYGLVWLKIQIPESQVLKKIGLKNMITWVLGPFNGHESAHLDNEGDICMRFKNHEESSCGVNLEPSKICCPNTEGVSSYRALGNKFKK